MAVTSQARYRREEIPKPDGSGVRKLGIPTVVDRIIQRAIAQQLQPLFEPLFSDGSYGYRPGRSAQQAIRKVRAHAEQGYGYAVEMGLSKYFDTLNHELLLNIVRKQIQDKRVIELIKKYLKSGVMEKGVRQRTEEGSPQGGPLSPLLANIYLNEYDQEMESRGVTVIRYADDIVLLAKSKRAAISFMESSRAYLENRLKLQVNVQKSKVVTVVARKHFKFLGFALGKNRKGIYVRVHPQSLTKAKKKVEGTNEPKPRQKRTAGHGKRKGLYSRMGWLLLCSRYEMNSAKLERMAAKTNAHKYIWKQWKKPRTRVQDLRKLGVPEWQAYQWGNIRLGYWCNAGSAVLNRSVTNEKLTQAGYYDFPAQYERLCQLHLSG